MEGVEEVEERERGVFSGEGTTRTEEVVRTGLVHFAFYRRGLAALQVCGRAGVDGRASNYYCERASRRGRRRLGRAAFDLLPPAHTSQTQKRTKGRLR